MRNTIFKHLLFATGTFFLLSAVVLWSFNTLAELFGGPSAQYEHAAAGVALLMILGWSLSLIRHTGNGRRPCQGHYRRLPDDGYEQ